MALTKIDDRGLKTPIDLIDDEKIRLGTGNDLDIYHNGTDSKIRSNGHPLKLESDSIILKAYSNNDVALTSAVNGAVELYYDNVLKLNTESAGTRIQGQLILPNTSGVSLSIKDNGKAAFGTGDDLQIYHSGSHSFISNTTGTLQLENAGNITITKGGTENMARFVPDGAAELYYDNVKTFETTGGGAIIRGTEGGDADLFFYADEGDDNADQWRIQAHSNGAWYLKNYGSGSWETNIEAVNNGNVALYHDNTKRFETSSYGAAVTGYLQVGVGGGTNGLLANDSVKLRLGTDQDLEIYHDGTDSKIYNSTGQLQIIAAGAGDLVLQAKNGENSIVAKEDAQVELYHNNTKKLETTSDGINVDGFVYATRLDLDDGEKILLGTGDDLQLYHNGTSSYISNQTGWLAVLSDNIIFKDKDDGDTFITCNHDGAVDIFYDHSKKFNTSSGGCYVHGNLYPTSNGSGSIGTSSEKWNSAHFSSNIYVGGASNELGTTTFYGSGGAGGSIMWGSYDSSNKFRVHNNGTIYAVSTTISSISSERRTKKDIVNIEADKAWSTLKDIKLYSYSFKNDSSSTTHYGPIVDEVPSEMVVPTSESDDVGVINTYNSEMLLFRAYSALQQAMIKIETLETKVAALEAA